MKLFDILWESETELSEQAALKRLFQGFTKNVRTLTHDGLKAVHPVFAKDLDLVFTAKRIDGVTKIDDLVMGISKGTLSSRAYGDLITGLLKTKGVSDDYIKMIAKSWVEDPRFIKNYTSGGDKLTKATLLKKGYSPTAADEILKAAKGSQKYQNALKGGTKTASGGTKTAAGGAAGTSRGVLGKAWDSTFGRLFSGGKSKPKVRVNTSQTASTLGKVWKTFVGARKILIVTSLVALGYAGYVVYQAIQDLLGVDPLPDLDDTDAPKSVKDWKKCIVDEFEGKNDATAGADESGVYLQISVSEFAGKQTGGWIRFYSDYRVTTQSGETGKWDCNQEAIKSINEQSDDSVMEMDNDVEVMIDLLDFPVSTSDLQSAHALLKKYKNNGRGKSFLSLYQRSGLGGGDLRKTLNYVVTTKATSTRLKDEMLAMISSIEGSSVKDTEGTKSDKDNAGGGTTNTSHLTVVWDDKSSGGGSVGGTKYRPCDSFPLTVGCISDKIKDIQRCLNPTANLKVDGYFGPLTLKAMQDKSLFADNDKDDVKITEDIYNNIMSKCEKKDGTETIKPATTDNVSKREKLEPIKTLEVKPLVVLDTEAMLKKYGKENLLQQANKTIDGEKVINLIREKVRFTLGGRYILNVDEELTENQLKSINTWMSGIGYSLDKKRETLDKSRYVWVAKDNASKRIARNQNRIDRIKSNNEE